MIVSENSSDGTNQTKIANERSFFVQIEYSQQSHSRDVAETCSGGEIIAAQQGKM
jgi:hypothetical protein